MLDTWVFEKVPEFFASASSELQKELHKSQSVFFLHLLGKLYGIANNSNFYIAQ